LELAGEVEQLEEIEPYRKVSESLFYYVRAVTSSKDEGRNQLPKSVRADPD